MDSVSIITVIGVLINVFLRGGAIVIQAKDATTDLTDDSTSKPLQRFPRYIGGQFEPSRTERSAITNPWYTRPRLLKEIIRYYNKKLRFLSAKNTNNRFDQMRDSLGDGFGEDVYGGIFKRQHAARDGEFDGDGEVSERSVPSMAETAVQKRLYHRPGHINCDLEKISINTLIEYIQYGRVCGNRVSGVRFGLGGK